MRHFEYRDGVLFAEDVSIAAIAASVGTPFYCYSTATLERHYKVFKESFGDLPTLVAYSVKANGNLAVIKTLADLGAGADVVSAGELKRAIAAGVPPERIVFSGVGKTRDEMAAALLHGIYQFNVESEPEAAALSEVASALGKTASITFRLNPDVDAKTHAKISTGKAENKFGIAWERTRAAYANAAQLPGIKIVGVDMHIGSQLTDLAPMRQAFTKMREMILALRSDGHEITRADLGGGLGIAYEENSAAPPLPQQYGAMVREVLGDLGVQFVFEPGRLIVGNAGILVSKVIYVKPGEARNFLIVDAAMNDLLRPAMYEAHHDIAPVNEAPDNARRMPMTVVGPVCETGDTFATDRSLPEMAADDLVVFHSAGAYGAVMASTYNTRALVPEVLVRGAAFAVVRPRVEVDSLIALDKLPDWSNT
jgi:diaminopimelate decarboxylase